MGNLVSQETCSHFVEEGKLGKGSFGEVKLVYRKKDTGRILYALKEIPYGGFFTNSTKEMIAKEISVQQGFNHPNVTNLQSFWYEKGTLYGGKGYILLEYCSEGCTRDFAPHGAVPMKWWYFVNEILDDFRLFNVCNVLRNCFWNLHCNWSFAIQMLSALEYVHARKVIHRDLKLENILISCKNPNKLEVVFKLTDFGVSVGRNEEMATIASKLRTSNLNNNDSIRT